MKLTQRREAALKSGATYIVVVGMVLVTAPLGQSTKPLRAETLQKEDIAFRGEHMAQVLKSLRDYRECFQTLPAATHRDELGRPVASWRLEVMPFIEQLSWGVKRGQSWLTPYHLTWLRQGGGSLFWLDETQSAATSFKTTLVAVTGPGTAFPDDFGYRGELPPDLILLIECRNSQWAWTQPGDLDLRSIPTSIGLESGGRGFAVGFADGEAWYLDRSIPVETLRSFLTIEGAQSHDREQVLRLYRRG